MNTQQFKNLFSERAIRVWMDWEDLNDDNCSVSTMVCTTPEELGKLQTVWYQRDGQDAEWRDQRARRVTVNDEASRGTIYFDGQALDVPHLFLVLDIGQGEHLLLDGNHRAVSLVAKGAPFSALLVALHGPDDPMVFPDLIHQSHAQSNESEWKMMTDLIDKKFLA